MGVIDAKQDGAMKLAEQSICALQCDMWYQKSQKSVSSLQGMYDDLSAVEDEYHNSH
jgi:hypothetical protein